MSVGRSEEETDFCRYVRSPIHLESQHCVCCKITSALSPEEFPRRMYGEIYRYSEAIPVLFKKICLTILDNRFCFQNSIISFSVYTCVPGCAHDLVVIRFPQEGNLIQLPDKGII